MLKIFSSSHCGVAAKSLILLPTARMSDSDAAKKQSKFNRPKLKQGRSPLDWIRLNTSLKKTKRSLREITEAELSQHNTRGNAWTCLNGEIYSISEYLEFHPGGEDELMRVAGLDGTKLFNQTHRWVNYQRMLEPYLVGYLQKTLICPKKSADNGKDAN